MNTNRIVILGTKEESLQLLELKETWDAKRKHPVLLRSSIQKWNTHHVYFSFSECGEYISWQSDDCGNKTIIQLLWEYHPDSQLFLASEVLKDPTILPWCKEPYEIIPDGWRLVTDEERRAYPRPECVALCSKRQEHTSFVYREDFNWLWGNELCFTGQTNYVAFIVPEDYKFPEEIINVDGKQISLSTIKAALQAYVA